MPFTLAHPAAVLPLRRTQLVFSALLIGSMAPDFPDFVYVDDPNHWFHSAAGVLLCCLPMGLFVLWLYHAVVKRPLLDLAPDFLRARISEEGLAFPFTPASRFLAIVVSLLVGCVSHVLWDSFTHPYGYFVRHWPMLSMTVMTYHAMPLSRALQLGCSVVGVVLVTVTAAWWIYRAPLVASPVRTGLSSTARLVIPATGLAIAGVVGYFYGFVHNYGEGWKYSLIDATVAAMSTGCVEILLFSGAWHANRRARKRKALESEPQEFRVTAER